MTLGLSIVIPYWNCRHLAAANLPSVLAAARRLEGPWEILAVDDGSTDRLDELLHTTFPMVRLIQRARNEGFSAAIRSGVAEARHEILYFLNSDVRVEAETFQSALGHFTDPRVCAVASLDAERMPFGVPAITNRLGLLGVRYLTVPQPQQAMPILFATGGHSAYRAEAFRALGGYDELFAPAYWEDIDCGVRAHTRGWVILLEPRSRVHHEPRGTMARKYTPRQIEALRAGHRWRFTRRHSPSPGALAWLALAMSHGAAACPPFSTGCCRSPRIASSASASRAVLRRFSASAVKRVHGVPWRVAYLSATGDIVGGGELSLLTLLAGLNRRHVEPALVCPTEGELARRARGLGIAVHVVRLPPTVRGLMGGAVARLARWMRSADVDLVHVNSAGRTLLLSGMAARALGIPVVWHVRVATPEGLSDRLGAALAQQIIVTSQYVASRFRRAACASKVCQIPNPVDLSRFRPDVDGRRWRVRHRLPSEICVGVFGRFDRWKRFDLALEAMARARQEEPALHLVMAGDGPERRALEALSRRLGPGEAVSFVGWQDDPAEAMAAMDLVLHPTPGEHFGRVFIEAMASGKPVVAPNAGGAAELVVHEQTGLLAADASPGALASVLVRLARDAPRRAEMGRTARRRAEQLFDAGAIAERVVGIYENLLGAA